VKVTFSDCDRACWVLGHARNALALSGDEDARRLLLLALRAVEAEQNLLHAVNGVMGQESVGRKGSLDD
jgi:hypothetical protein